MPDARIEGLADLIKNRVVATTEEAKMSTYINGVKIVVTVGKDGVKTRIAEPIAKRVKKPSSVTPEQRDAIKEVRKQLKGNLDIVNLLVLLVRVKEELKKIKISNLDKDKQVLVNKLTAEVGQLLVKSAGIKTIEG